MRLRWIPYACIAFQTLSIAGTAAGAAEATDAEREALARLRGSIDGQIVWESHRSGSWRIWTMNADGTGVRQLSEGPGDDTDARFSPDGKTIAFTRTERGQRSVWLMGRDGAHPRKLIDDAGSPVFTRDGQRLHFARKRGQGGEHFDTWVYDLVAGAERRVFPPDGVTYELDVWGAEASDDESRFVAWSPRPRGTWVLSADGTVRAHVHGGCEGQVSPDQRYGYGVKSAGTFIRFNLADGGNPLEFNVREGAWSHTYFPRVSADGNWLVYGACPPNQHDHDTSDYELFIVRLADWHTQGEPVRLTFNEATDRWPDICLVASPWPGGEYDMAGGRPAPLGPLPLLTFAAEGKDADAGTWGTWPGEGDVSIRATYVNEDAEGGVGGAVRIDYEIRGEPNSVALWLSPANGRLDLRRYDRLALWARGTVSSFTVVIEDAHAEQAGGSLGVGDLRVRGVTGEWQRFELPLSELVPRAEGGSVDLAAVQTLALAAIVPHDAREGTLEVDNLVALPRE